jgi:hypothetical protein
MSLKGQLGRAVLKRIETLPAVQAEMERAERRSPVLQAARGLAYGSLDDEQAKAQLAGSLNADAAVVEDALALLGRQRGYGYVEDRAYRLLAAAAAETEVAPIQPEHAELFAEEESIGRISIEQAFERLAEIEPGLVALRDRARTRRAGDDQGCGLPERVRLPLRRLVGAGAISDHQLLRTNLATSIVHQYLEQLAGNRLLDSSSTSYFESPIRHFVATGLLFDRTRPRRSEPGR